MVNGSGFRDNVQHVGASRESTQTDAHDEVHSPHAGVYDVISGAKDSHAFR
jgi:hypothetical protein